MKPGVTETELSEATALLAQGKLEAGIERLSALLVTEPDLAEGYFVLAQALFLQGKLEAAAERLRRGLTLMPGRAEAHNNLGLLYLGLGRYDDAIESFRRALDIKPDLAWAHCHLGNALHAKGKSEAAIESYRKALTFDPFHAESHLNLGNVLKDQGDLYAAVESYRRALSLRADSAVGQVNLGIALQAQGELDAAIETFRKALVLQPENTDARSGVIFTMNIHPTVAAADRLAEARRYGSTLATRVSAPFTHWNVAPIDRSGGGPLRVGLVSGDLRAHPVGFFMENVLKHVDRSRLELVAYPTQLQEDALTDRLKSRFVGWYNIARLDDQAAAARIRADGIHILIDLSGHTAANRLPVLAWKPAPVQLTWLGYFATTGVPGIDYLLADRVSVPESRRDQFTEAIWYLPHSRFCFTPPENRERFQCAAPPALRNGSITFGCFQDLIKLSDLSLAAWGRIFRTLPSARLRVQNRSMGFALGRAHLRDRLRRAGIAPDRVILAGYEPRENYLLAYADVDIILDTFPYCGATTTCEALWMGVPTLTLAGDTMVSRQGASLLTCAGLGDWVAENEDDYVHRAVTFASDASQLARLRSSLRERVLASPLFDAPRFARSLEEALLGIWQEKIGTVASFISGVAR